MSARLPLTPSPYPDPSYTQQLLCLTFPMIGNYGVPDGATLDKLGLPAFFESSKIHVAGLIVADNSPDYRWVVLTSRRLLWRSSGDPVAWLPTR